MKKFDIRTSPISVLQYDDDYKLLLDGDMFLYRAAWATNNTSFTQASLSLLFSIHRTLDELSSSNYTFYLSSVNNHRRGVWPLYKWNRFGTEKPVHLDRLRELAKKILPCKSRGGFEADDLIQRDSGENTIIVSNDKDFDQIVGFHSKIGKKCSLYWVNEQQAMVFFYRQLLTGDRADNIPGLSEKAPKRGIGPARAAKIIPDGIGRIAGLRAVYRQYKAKYGNNARFMLVFNYYLLQLGRPREWTEPLAEEINEYSIK